MINVPSLAKSVRPDSGRNQEPRIRSLVDTYFKTIRTSLDPSFRYGANMSRWNATSSMVVSKSSMLPVSSPLISPPCWPTAVRCTVGTAPPCQRIQLGVSKVYACTLAGALGERPQVSVQSGVFQPSLRHELVRLGKYVWVEVDCWIRHCG